MTEPRYGRFDEAEFRRRGDDRRLVLDGKPYRIAELVPLMDGSARYQAWPVEEEDAPAAAREGTTVSDEAAEAMTVLEIHNTGTDSGYSTEGLPGTVLDTAHLPAPRRPVLATWARANGWKGHGPIPKDVRARYEAEFDMAWPVDEG